MAEEPPVQLIVDSVYLSLVADTLGDLGIGVAEVHPHDALGLSRVTLTGQADDGPDRLADWELDAVLAELRRRIAAANGGWLPAIGKNRTTGTVIGQGGHSRIMGGHPRIMGGEPQIMGGHPRIMGAAVADDDFSDDEVAVTLLAVGPGAAGLSDAGAPVPVADPVRIGLVDTAEVTEWTVTEPVPSWRAHASFVRAVVEHAAPDAELIVRPVLGEPDGTAPLWDVATAMLDLVVDDRVDLLLLPLACFTADGEAPLLIARAIERIGDRALVIAAAGNHLGDATWAKGRHGRSPAWPAALATVRAVGVEAMAERPPWVDVGTSAASFAGPFFTGPVTMPDGTRADAHGAAHWSGTSFAAAWAAGAVAARMRNGSTSAPQAWQRLLAAESATP